MASRSAIPDHFHLIPTNSGIPLDMPLSLPEPSQAGTILHSDTHHVSPQESSTLAFVKGGKRKRLSKACDACHKSKRRCDGTAPCSNCYFASKDCTYTDSSGRPVPAPRNIHPQLGVDHLAVDAANSAPYRRDVHHPAARSHPSAEPSSSRGVRRVAGAPTDLAAIKRVRPEGLDTSSTVLNPLGSPPAPGSASGSPSSLLDPTTTHELVNLFFTHCNPHRMVIHKSSFSAALTHEQLPPFLLLAVCATAAPHSKEVASKALTPRLAGVPFFKEAVSMMFDSSGTLRVEPTLATAQTLCLLELHEISASHSWTRHYRYFDLVLKILEDNLQICRPDESPSSSPPRSPESRTARIERECTRRCFWLVQVMSWINGIYTYRPMRPRSLEMMRHVPLPLDETSFDLAVPPQDPREYMHIAAPRTKHASIFGHLCRVLSLYQRLQAEISMREGSERIHAVNEVKAALQEWVDSLADHLRFSEVTLEKQVSMFETSSNSGAWCFCFAHVLHPCLVLSMTEVDGREAEVVPWVRSQLGAVFAAVGGRAKNTILSACALWSYSKYQPEDPQLHAWDAEFERIWGFRVAAVADQWRKCQEEQRLQIGRTCPVESASTPESPPAFVVADSSSSSSSSSPHELEPLPHHDRHLLIIDPQNVDVAGNGNGNSRFATGYISHPSPDSDLGMPVGGGVPGSVNSSRRDSLSLPSLKASGLLDSWKPPTDAFAYSLTLTPRERTVVTPTGTPPSARKGDHAPHVHHPPGPSPPQHAHLLAHPPPPSHPHQHMTAPPPPRSHPHSYRPVHPHPHPHPQAHAQPPQPPPSSASRTGQSMPVGLNWLNNES